MNVAVCVKQIPDPAAPGELDPSTLTLKRDGKLILDDSDSYGVEMALQLADQAGGGEVTLVSMAPRGETGGLRTALAMGAAKAILVSDDALAGSDALGTAQVAELLGMPSVTFANKIEVADGAVRVHRQTEAGYDEVECPLPALVTVTAGVVEPRYPSFKGIMAAKSKPIEELKVADLGLDPTQVGAAGARQEMVSVEEAEERQAGEVVVDEGDAHERIIAFLEQLKVI